MTTKTKQVDRFGNVSYRVERDGEFIGTVDKTCGGYNATLPSGSWIPTRSIVKAVALLERS